MKKWIANISVALISIIIVLIATETSLRFTKYNYPRLVSAIHNYPFPGHYFREDPVRGFDISENFKPDDAYVFQELTYEVWSNEIGCFDTDAKNIGDYILLLGDSFAHSYAQFEDKWGIKIEKLLGYRVLKCGVPGYGTRAEFFKAKDIISKMKRPPKIIIVGYYINDLQDDYLFPEITIVKGTRVFDRYMDIQTGRITLKNNMDEEFRIWREFGTRTYPDNAFLQRIKFLFKKNSVIYNLYGLYRNPPDSRKANFNLHFFDYPWIKTAWEKHFNNFREFKKMADDNDAVLVVVIIPHKYQVSPERYDNIPNIDTEKPNKILREFFNGENINYLDLLPYFKEYSNRHIKENPGDENELYWENDDHWNKKGNYFAGLLTAKYILENNMLNTKDKEKKINRINNTLSEDYQVTTR